MAAIKTLDMEVALASHFKYAQNLIVPNISWGLYFPQFRKPLHECDLLICTAKGYLWECEIKISKADLIKDKDKKHGHHHPAIKRLYFAIPKALEEYIDHIPQRAGIILVDAYRKKLRCNEIRKPRQDSGVQITDQQRLKMALLGCMRVWKLKQKLAKKG